MQDWTGKVRVLMLKPPKRSKGSYTYATVRVGDTLILRSIRCYYGRANEPKFQLHESLSVLDSDLLDAIRAALLIAWHENLPVEERVRVMP